MGKYAIGIDFGTLSARALIAEIGTGRELASAVMEYPHGVMDECLPDGTKLKPDWALQHPQDYIDCMQFIIQKAVAEAGIPKEDIIGLGVDFTSCTMIALDHSGVPLCFRDEYQSNPHAYVKLWKHHAAQEQANQLNALARERSETFLARYGGKTSSEWMFPKIMQVLSEDPALYRATGRFMEAADWIVYWMTGVEARGSCMAGYKSLWRKSDGYPSDDFFKALDWRLEHVVDEKIGRDVYPIGHCAGGIAPRVAEMIDLAPGTACAVAIADAHVSFPPTGLTRPGEMLIIMGTSNCHITVSETEKPVPGICGVVEDGIIPGLMAYEAGQPAVGDLFGWMVKHFVSPDYEREARARGISLHVYLTEKARMLKPGQSGLLALDWWNGNRSVLVDADLTGMLLGMTLNTKPEDIYRALIEATAYGTRMIIENFEAHGIAVDHLYACGGISRKNPMLMQIYSDVLNREIRIARSTETPALGSAMFGALAAGSARGGYDSITQAAEEMGGTLAGAYRPIAGNVPIYDALYREYAALYDYFGRGGNDVMKRLKRLKETQHGD